MNNIKLLLNVIINYYYYYYLQIQSTMYFVILTTTKKTSFITVYSRQHQVESDLYHWFLQCPTLKEKHFLERSEYSEKSSYTWLLLRLIAMLSKELFEKKM